MKRLRTIAGFVAVAGMPAASNLLITLVLVRALGIDGFATWAIVEPTLLIFGTVAALGTQYGVLFTTASGVAEPRRALGAAMTMVLPVSFGAGTIVWTLLRRQAPEIGYVNLVLPLVGEAMGVLIVASLRGQRMLGLWVLFESLRTMGVLLCCFAIAYFRPDALRNVNDVLLIRGLFVAVGVVTVIMALRLRPVVEKALLVRMLRYGLPIAAAAMLQLVINSADRYLLALLSRPASEIALYAAHQRLAGLISVLAVTPINLWFATEAIRRDTVADAPFFRTVVTSVLGLLAILVTGAFLMGPLIWPYLFPKIAFDPLVYALLAAAVIPQALGIVTNIGPLREKKTHLGAIAVAISGVTMVAFGLPLIRLLGAVGAAASRVAALSATAIAGRIFSQRVAPVSHTVMPMLPFIAAPVFATLMLFSPDWGLPVWPGLLAAILAIFGGFYQNFAGLLAMTRYRPKIADADLALVSPVDPSETEGVQP
jgi:O-antigen/teichoic acid export membrane protein